MTRHSVDISDEAISSAKVLVVDDDERNLLALSEVLSPHAEVVTASSGRDALRLLLRQEFAVILLDVFMPGLDGYETAGLIRDRDQTARIPIIFLSAVNKETEHLMRGYEMGAVDYVFKPVDPLVLKSKVSVFVDLFQKTKEIERKALHEQALLDANLRANAELLHAEQELRRAEQRQAAIIQSLPMVLYLEPFDSIRRVPDFFSGDIEAITGVSYDELKADPKIWWDRLHPDDRDRVREGLAARSKSGKLSIEYRWQCRDDSYKHFLDQAVLLKDLDGQPLEFAGTITDITDQRSLENQLIQAQKMDAIGKLTGGVAHDFNNLLAAMLGGIHVLQRRLQIGAREQIVLDQMRHATEQGTELVRRMMAFARQQDLIPTSVDPATLCDSVAGLVNHTLGGTVVVDWRCPNQRFNLFVDRSQLELALMNLIINARDAMPKGGEIAVDIEPCAKTTVRQPALRIRVSDQGAGIPEKIITRVTEPFFTTKETGRGTGLGLSMVAGFVQQSGGELKIESTTGKGTVVELILPATEAAATSVDSAQIADFSWLADKKLMLIDDDDSVRVVLSEQFRDAGGTVDDFSSGHDAIAAMKRDPAAYDYVLSDFAMPGIDGLETLQAMRKLAPAARIALMTGYADEALLTGDHKIPLIRKPIDFRKMAAAFAA